MVVDPALCISKSLLANSCPGGHSGGNDDDGGLPRVPPLLLPCHVLRVVVLGIGGVGCLGVRDGLLAPSVGDELPAHGLSPHVLLLWATHRVLGVLLAGDLLEGDCLVTDIRVGFSRISGINLLLLSGEDTDKNGYSSKGTWLPKFIF